MLFAATNFSSGPKNAPVVLEKPLGVFPAGEKLRFDVLWMGVHIGYGEIEVRKKENAIRVTAQVACLGRTGVEMEAMTAVAISALTIYDMMKWADKSIKISEVMLTFKSGGKSGDYRQSS